MSGWCSECDAKMYHMRQASVRDLRYNFPEVEKLLARGEEVQITKRKRVIGRLVPERPVEPPPQWPDFVARAKKIFGDKKFKVTGAQRIREERDGRA